MRRMLSVFLILSGLICIAFAILMAMGKVPMFNPWSDILLLLGAFLLIAMALMLLHEERAARQAQLKRYLAYVDAHKLSPQERDYYQQRWVK